MYPYLDSPGGVQWAKLGPNQLTIDCHNSLSKLYVGVNMKKLIFILLCAFGFVSANAFAFPLPKHNFSIMMIPPTFTTIYNFEGIVALNVDLVN
jgi:hypothetical protein